MKAFTKKLVATYTASIYLALLLPASVAAEAPYVNASGQNKIEPLVAIKSEGSASIIHAVTGGLVTADGAEIEIPAGALAKDTEIKITRLPATEATGDELMNVTCGGGGWRFEPAGTQFLKPVTIRIAYDATINENPEALENLYTYFYNTKTNGWERLERKGIDKGKLILSSYTTHFTDMINATLTLPEGPSPLSFNINSIKNLEAADPSTGVAKLEGLEGDSFGGGNFRINLQLPAGRANMTPQVALTYSTAGTGLCGRGFDVQAGGCISTDTRWGLPDYADYTKNTYMKDGVLLVGDGNDSATVRKYNREKETGYEEIRWIVSGSENYWQVTDKSGTIRTYGKKVDSWNGLNANWKYTWYLNEERDVHGNTISYDYVQYDNYVYVSIISYTGYKDIGGPYKVKFNYADRKDARLDGRGKFVSKQGKLLTDVWIGYEDGMEKQESRSYFFEQEFNELGFTQLKAFGQRVGTQVFYKYSFEYYMPERDVTTNRYKIFDDAKEWYLDRGLQVKESVSAGVEGSSSVGAGFGFKRVDVRGSAGGSMSASSGESQARQTLVDIDGDGRSDSVTKIGSGVNVRYQNEQGFIGNEIAEVKLLGAPELEYEKQTGRSVGWNLYGGVGLSILVNPEAGKSYATTHQSSWNELHTSFQDVDGDGLQDFLEEGKPYYLKNLGGSFVSRDFHTTAGILQDSCVKIPDPKKVQYDESFYQQSPFRAWKAPNGGMIEVVHSITALKGSSDGLTARTYYADETLPSQVLSIPSRGTDDSAMKDYPVAENKSLYFVPDGGMDTNGDCIDWNIKIRYKTIKYFSDLANMNVYSPPGVVSSGTYSGYDEALQKFYGYNMETYQYDLLDWQNSKDLTSNEVNSACVEIIKSGYFLPNRLSPANFVKLAGKLGSVTTSLRNVYTSLFYSYYVYDQVSNEYYHVRRPYDISSSAGSVTLDDGSIINAASCVINLMLKLDEQTRLDIGQYAWIDGTRGVSYANNGKPFFEKKGTPISVTARTIGVPGFQGEKGKDLFIDVVEGRTWKVLRNPGNPELIAVDSTGAETMVEGVAVSLSPSGNTLLVSVSTIDPGTGTRLFDQNYQLTDFRRIAEKISKAEMSEIRSNKVSFSPGDEEWKKLTKTELFAVKNALSVEQYTKFRALYDIDPACITDPAIIPPDEDCDSFLLRSLMEAETAEFAVLLDEYAWYVFLNKTFPYYELNGDWYVLKVDWDPDMSDKNIAKLDAATIDGYTNLIDCSTEYYLGYWRTLNRSARYYAEGVYTVTDNAISLYDFDYATSRYIRKSISISTWDSNTDYSTVNNATKAMSYWVNVPKGDENSTDFDFSAATSGYEDVQMTVETNDILYGGKNRWLYGIWNGTQSGKHAFSEGTLYSNKTNNNNLDREAAEEKARAAADVATRYGTGSDPVNTLVSYSLPNTLEMGETDESGVVYTLDEFQEFDCKENVKVDFLIGTVADITEEKLVVGEVKTELVKVSEKYCPLIHNDRININRSGGSSYYDIPGIMSDGGPGFTAQSGIAPFTMVNLRKSSGEATDVVKGLSGSINTGKHFPDFNASGSISGTKGENSGDSSMYQSVQDINGDGIIDILKNSGSTINVFAGSRSSDENDGIVFTKYYQMEGGADLSYNSNDSTVYGASLSASGSMSIGTNANGKPVSIKTLNGSQGTTYAESNNTQNIGLMDLNGDGLPDFLLDSSDGGFRINIGDKFELFSSDTINTVLVTGLSTNEMENFGFSASIGKGSGSSLSQSSTTKSFGVSFTGGVSYSASINKTADMFMDINGDGLPDKISKTEGNEYLSAFINYGSSFSVNPITIEVKDWDISGDDATKFIYRTDGNIVSAAITSLPIVGSAVEETGALDDVTDGSIPNPFGININHYIDVLSYDSSISIGISGSVNVKGDIAFPLPWPVAFLNVHVSASSGGGVNGNVSLSGVSVRMMDIDGDGLVDHVLRVPGTNTLYVKRNITQKLGLLKTIGLPQGGSYELDWSRVGNTPEMPQSRTCLSTVTLNDSPYTKNEVPGSASSYTTTYTYSEGKYDRATKDFWGFEQVEAIRGDPSSADRSTTKTMYKNTAYYSKGMVECVSTFAPDGTELTRQQNTIDEAPYARVLEESRTQFEGETNSITTTLAYTYNDDTEYGNVTFVRDCGGTYDDQTDDVTALITYWNNSGKCLHNQPLTITVSAGNKPVRSRIATYNDSGNIARLTQVTGTGDPLVTKLEWDNYGNLTAIEGVKGDRTEYTYDTKFNQYVEKIGRKAPGISEYKSSIDWDIPNGLKKTETDENSNIMRYEYDEFLRLQSVWSPYDEGETAAVAYAYVTPEGSSGWYAVTDNKILTESSDPSVMQTVVEVDGLGRKLRMAKRGERREGGIDENDVVEHMVGWNVSGAMKYDDKGRTVAEGQNIFVNGSLDKLLETRITELVNPTEKAYDYQDRIKSVFMRDSEPDTFVYKQSVHYGITGQTAWTETIDPKGNITLQERDPRGNITAVIRKDGAKKELTRATYEYNPLGEMTMALDSANNKITVEYDLLGRKTAIESKDSGRKETWYDRAGNVSRETDNVLRANGQYIQYEYDTMNRLTKIDYPISIDTTYKYGVAGTENNCAGRIVTTTDESGSIEYQYGKIGEIVREERTIKRLKPLATDVTAVMEYSCDYLGRMQTITFPDNEVLTYGYDEGGQIKSVRGRRINHDFFYVNDIAYDEFGQRKYIEYGNGTKTVYAYDAKRRWLSNIKTICGANVYQDIDYAFDVVGNIESYTNSSGKYETTQKYFYDSLYQLTSANGTTVYKPSGIVSYTSKYKQDFTFSTDGLCNMDVKESTSSVTPQSVIGKGLNYKLGYEYYKGYSHRLESAGTRFYRYDGNGNVITEREGGHAPVTENNAILNDDGRIYSTNYGFALSTDTENSDASSTIYQRDYQWNEKNLLVRTDDKINRVTYAYGSDGQRSNKYTRNGEILYFNKMWQTTDMYDTIDLRQSKHIYVGDTRLVTKFTLDDDSPNWGHEDESTYWYHSDHLGSAQLVTKKDGVIHERIEYTPYGELWVDANYDSGIDKSVFRFTGKEFDEETGFYYYGARYLDPRLSRWISTDPALGEYIPGAPVNEEARKRNGNLPGMGGVYNSINLNLYHYAGNNPVKYTDPDGRVVWFAIPIIAIALIGVGGVAHAPTIHQPDVANQLSRTAYDDGTTGPAFQNKSAIRSRETFSLSSDAVAAVGSAMPRGMLGPNDYQDYSDRSPTKGCTLMDGVGLVGTVLENLTDGKGNKVGDIKLNIGRVNGSVNTWNIQRTMIGLDGRPDTTIMKRDEANQYLIDNKQRLIENGVYADVEKSLDN